MWSTSILGWVCKNMQFCYPNTCHESCLNCRNYLSEIAKRPRRAVHVLMTEDLFAQPPDPIPFRWTGAL